MSNDDAELKKVVQAIMKMEAKKKLKEAAELDLYFAKARQRSMKLGGYI